MSKVVVGLFFGIVVSVVHVQSKYYLPIKNERMLKEAKLQCFNDISDALEKFRDTIELIRAQGDDYKLRRIRNRLRSVVEGLLELRSDVMEFDYLEFQTSALAEVEINELIEECIEQVKFAEQLDDKLRPAYLGAAYLNLKDL